MFVVDADTHPQTLAVLHTRAEPLGITLVVADLDGELPADGVAGVLVSYPGTSGRVRDLAPVIAAAHERGALAIVATDLLALTLLTPPGELGADVVVGSAQRLGVPFGFGGPHAGFMSVRAGLERSMPGPAGRRERRRGRRARPTGSPSRPASSTSGARRRPATSARHRCCSP